MCQTALWLSPANINPTATAGQQEGKTMASIFDLFKKIEKKEDSTPITHIIVGLGNPGEKYTYTRHNAGFLAIDFLTNKYSISCDKAKFKSFAKSLG